MAERKCRRLLRIPQAVAYLDHVVTPATIRGWILRRKIEYIRLNGVVCIPADVLDAMVEGGRTKAAIPQRVRKS
jgi:hypothetical protein